MNKLTATAACTLLAGVLALSGCERPPMNSDQVGYRGTGMVQISNPRLALTPGEIPAALPAASSDGPKAGDIYQNVQVLGGLSVGEFTRLMTAITEWVAPEQGCNYCHNPANLASDDIYTKLVSRRMLQMTQHINASYESHVGATGVTCYTCHRGNNVPAMIWTEHPAPRAAQGMAGWRDGQNLAGQAGVAFTSLPYDPFARYLEDVQTVRADVRVNATTALPAGTSSKDIKDTEATYALMMQMSDGLGVNCTYCHNSRAFANWQESNPARVTAWHGLGMVADLNEAYLTPLASALPEHRRGPLGDAPKAYCATCHQGAAKPLNGAQMLVDYPSLSGR
jgi:photosynthetic reaction center cytochrome c subunit